LNPCTVEDPDHPPDRANYSLHPAPDSRSFDVLYWGGCPAVRTRDPRRLAAGVAAHLGGHAPPAPGLLRTSFTAVEVRGGVVLVSIARSEIPRLDRRLRASGATVVDAPWCDVQPDALEHVLAPPSLPAPVLSTLSKAVVAIAGRRDPGRESFPGPGRRRVVGLVDVGVLGGTRSQHLLGLLGRVEGSDRVDALEGLAALLEGVPVAGVPADPSSVVAAVVDLAGGR
jgi:hypothetical protein